MEDVECARLLLTERLFVSITGGFIMNIITISREFGSGGRELGKRLSDYMHFSYYDKEILDAVSSQSNLDTEYVEKVIDNGMLQQYPINYGRTFSSYTAFQYQHAKTELLLKQQQIIKKLAQIDNCVIVGRAADVILRDYHPLNLFIYADMSAKVARCRKYTNGHENLTNHDLEMKIKQVDRYREQYYELLMGRQWGAIENYHLCVNTSEIEIKKLSSILSEYAQNWFRRNEN